MKAVIQENLLIRIIKVFISFLFLFFLLISKKTDESKFFIILFTIILITLFLLCFISAFQKIEITNEKIIKSFIFPVKKIDRNLVIDMKLREKKDGTYDLLFTMENEKVSIFHIGSFFPIEDIIECLNNENITEISEKIKKDNEKTKTIFFAKILICLVASIGIAFGLIIIIGSLLYLENIYIKKIILFVCFGIFFLGFFDLFLKKIRK